MTYNEYRSQKAVGTIDFRKAAYETRSAKVLVDIVKICNDYDVLITVALNPYTPIRGLTSIVHNPAFDKSLHITAAKHPKVTIDVLDQWMKFSHINDCMEIRQHYRNLQIAAGVPEAQRLIVNLFQYISESSTKYIQTELIKQDGQTSEPANNQLAVIGIQSEDQPHIWVNPVKPDLQQGDVIPSITYTISMSNIVNSCGENDTGKSNLAVSGSEEK